MSYVYINNRELIKNFIKYVRSMSFCLYINIQKINLGHVYVKCEQKKNAQHPLSITQNNKKTIKQKYCLSHSKCVNDELFLVSTQENFLIFFITTRYEASTIYSLTIRMPINAEHVNQTRQMSLF